MRKRIVKTPYMISEARIEEAKQEFLGKKIEFKTQNNIRHVGTCEFLGPNQFFPSWGIQITVNRTPIPQVILDSIKIIE